MRLNVMAYANTTRLKLDGRQVDNLISYGMRLFDDAEIYVSPSKMSKLVREAARKYGVREAALVIDQYFASAELLTWESYTRALQHHVPVYDDDYGGEDIPVTHVAPRIHKPVAVSVEAPSCDLHNISRCADCKKGGNHA